MDTITAQFFNLKDVSSDWSLHCPVHGDVTMVIVFNGDLRDRSYCQQCFEEKLSTLAQKTIFNSNYGPDPITIEV